MKITFLFIFFLELNAYQNNEANNNTIFNHERESDEYTDNMMILRKRGQLLDLPDGGARIKFSPTMPPITIPPNLRFIPIESWNKVDQVWLNITSYPWPNDEQCK